MLTFIFILTTLTLFASPAKADETLLDYSTFDHTITIESIRAGNHDKSGTNEYVFQAFMFALHNTSEERNLAFEKRQKIEQDLGRFGDTDIEVLSQWQADEKTGDIKTLKIEGNLIRELTAKAMLDFKAKESEVAIMVEITLFEKNKKFFFFGNDQKIGTVSYYAVPPTKFDTPLRADQRLKLSDETSTNIQIFVHYDKPIEPQAAK